jgi:hypothetical protein
MCCAARGDDGPQPRASVPAEAHGAAALRALRADLRLRHAGRRALPGHQLHAVHIRPLRLQVLFPRSCSTPHCCCQLSGPAPYCAKHCSVELTWYFLQVQRHAVEVLHHARVLLLPDVLLAPAAAGDHDVSIVTAVFVGFLVSAMVACFSVSICQFAYVPLAHRRCAILCRFWSSYTNLSSIRSLRHYMDVSTSPILPPNTNAVRI